jgi:hypothetical protein
MIIDLLLIDLDIIASTIPDDQKPSPSSGGADSFPWKHLQVLIIRQGKA